MQSAESGKRSLHYCHCFWNQIQKSQYQCRSMRIQIQICNTDYSVPEAFPFPREKKMLNQKSKKLDNMRLKHTERQKHSPKPERIPMNAKTISSDGSQRNSALNSVLESIRIFNTFFINNEFMIYCMYFLHDLCKLSSSNNKNDKIYKKQVAISSNFVAD